ncbi:MAG: UvrD-helicase domain-containing protein [Oscillospiraceae bacterium]|nr:UvrD-helicase domain-containing protein [Oscillospiraceae bacterium]
MDLTPRQKQAVEYTDSDLLVAAAAGSGKTRVLVGRIIAALERGHNIDDFLIVTYTRAAAQELRGRIQRALLDRLREGDAGNLQKQLARMHRAEIGTIHAFCARLLREYAAEAGVRPNFRQLEGAEETALKRQALETALETLYAERPAGFDALAGSLGGVGGDRWLGEVILDLYNRLQAFPNPDMWMEEQIDNPYDASRYAELNAERARAFAEKLITKARRELSEIPELDAVYGPAFDADIANAAALRGGHEITRVKLKPARGMADIAKPFREIRERFYELLDASRGTPERDINGEYIDGLTRGIFTAVRLFGKVYGDLKFARGVLDFSDLEHIAHSLLCAPGADIGVRFAEVLVDEYQDVNQVQEEIIGALNSRVFMVGDVRQSIYGFRQADPGIFLGKYNGWADGGQGGARIILPHNFRSHPSILGAVNEIFVKIMEGYGEEELLRPPPGAGEVGAEPRATLVYRDMAAAEDGGLSRVQTEAEMVARLCRELVDGGGDPGDIAVLFRSRQGMAFFKRAIEAQGLAAAGQGDSMFDTPELITAQAYLRILDNPRDDVALLAVMRSPLYGFSPDELVGVRRRAGGDFYDALTAAAAAGDSKSGMLLRDLIYLRDLGADMGMDMLYHGMLTRLGLLELFGAMRGGAERRSNLLSVIPVAAKTASAGELCETLERMRRSGEETRESGRRGIVLSTVHKAKGLEFGTVILADTSREFNRMDGRAPVLFHREMGLGLKITDEELRVQYTTAKREAVAARLNEDMLREEMRILYVALTRARERLYVTVAAPDMAKQIERLSMGLDGAPDEYQLLSARSVSDWLLLALINDGKPEGTGAWEIIDSEQMTDDREQIIINSEQLTINNWGDDTEHLSVGRDVLIAPQDATIAPQDVTIPSKLTVSEVVGRDASARRVQTVTAPDAAIPSKLTVSEVVGRDVFIAPRAGATPGNEGIPPPFTKGGEFVRPRFMERHRALSAAERGTALHTALQTADLRACLTVEGAAAELRRLERERRLTPEQAGCVEPERVTRFAGSDLGLRALASGDMRREFPFSLLTPVRELMPELDSDEKTLFQGVVDLMFFEDGGWVIVDFKSGGARPEYARQLELYENAVRRVTGQRVKEGTVYYL